MQSNVPRLIISALRGGGGKTLLSLGLCRAFLQKGLAVKAYKKGPDYIDARWLTLASHAPCTNLDPYFLEAEKLQSLFVHAFGKEQYDIALTEGNRGLFDGQDVRGSAATSELARQLKAPIILSLDVTKMTRTSAALLSGMANFEKDIHIAGVVLNQVGSSRHENIVRASIEEYTDIPVLGALPRLKENPLPERHMGLSQSESADHVLDMLGKFITEHCDLDRIYNIAKSAPALEHSNSFWEKAPVDLGQSAPRIGYIYDDAFWFYYAENLEALQRAGAELVPLSILDTTPWPENLHGLYLGGGYPEEYAERIASSPHLPVIKEYSARNMPIYAECGGFMLLAKELIRENTHYPMTGVFPVATCFHPKPQGLGYIKAKVCAQNPFHPINTEFKGHEFHYSECVADNLAELQANVCLNLSKGKGMGALLINNTIHCDGLLIHSTFASYTHIFAPTCPWWAENFVTLAKNYKKNQA